MEDAAQLEAKQIISQYMSNDSVSLPSDASFSEREHLADLHKQIELRKAYRDSLRSLNLGLYALKQGMNRYGSDSFEEQLAKDYHLTIREVVEKQREASHGLQQLCNEYTLLGNSRQALIEQAELQKLQGVMRLQEQVRVKLSNTRVVKQWEREKATLMSEQKEMSKLNVVGKEIMQKRQLMLDRKHGEISNILICIGEGVEKAEELRIKLAEITKQHRDELHDDQSSDADLRSEDGKKDAGTGEAEKDTNTSPMFDSIDWNLGSVSMDLRLDLNFKNPNDFPDILTHLSSINTNKYHLKDIKKDTAGINNAGKGANLRKADEHKLFCQKGNRQGKTSSSEYSLDDTTTCKKSKMNDSTEKVIRQVVINGNENAKTNENRDKYSQRVVVTTPQPLQKQNSENMCNTQRRVSRKKATMSTQHDASPNQGSTLERKATAVAGTGPQDIKKMQEVDSGSTPARFRTPANKSTGNSVGASSNSSKSKREPQPVTQQQQQQQLRVHPEKKHERSQKQPEQQKRIRTIKMLSPVCTNQSKSVPKPSTNDNEPTPMDLESEDIQDVDLSTCNNNSLDFGMQSGSSEFDLNFSDDLRPDSGANEDDDLDFLSINPGRITRSKGQKKKANTSAKSSGSGDDMDTFDFTFGGSNSNESLEQPDDLF